MTLLTILAATAADTPPPALRWVIVIAPSIAAILSAILAGWFATRARSSEAEAARLRELEDRISAKKYDTYKPMIELLRDVFQADKIKDLGQDKIVDRLSDFAIWIAIYGSDDAVRTYQHFMQTIYHEPPPHVAVRLWAEFVLAARRDLGHDETKTTAVDVLAIRLNDLYENSDAYAAATLPMAELVTRHDWTPPWSEHESM